MAAVVDFPFDPVTPTTGAGQRARNNSISEVISAPARRAALTHGLSGFTAGLTTTSSAS